MVRYSVLGSGSCGNSYVFEYEGSSILVDAGYSMKQMKERLQAGGFDFGSIQALFLTHLHPDHSHSAGMFARRTGKPVYATAMAVRYSSAEYLAMRVPEACSRTIEPNKGVAVGPFLVSCFYTSHDSAGSCGYSISVGGRTFVIVTDTGVYSQEMVLSAKEADVLFLESNYDQEMLRTGPYPVRLQRRVAGERGHLSNDQARCFLIEAGFDRTRRDVYLVHLSENNNTPAHVASAMAGFNATVCRRGMCYCGEIAGLISGLGMVSPDHTTA